jgi:mono/diheme cytochrome c family protein
VGHPVRAALGGGLAVVLGAICAGTAAVGHQERPAIWQGVYTPAQAEHGAELFEISCGHCHAEDLGGGEGPALIGDGFTRRWYGESLHALFTHIHDSMPSDMPGILSEGDALALTSFLLSMNGFPTGPVQLDAARLASVLIVDEDGPGSVPNFSLVRVVGCLRQRPDGEWELADATAPERSRSGDISSAEAEAMAERAFGVETYELMDASYARPEPLEDQKVVVTGLLIRQPEQQDRINVTTVAATGRNCTPP